MKTLIQAYDNDYLKNIRLCCKYDIDYLIILYHQEFQAEFDYLRSFFNKHFKEFKIDFIQNIQELDDLIDFNDEIIIDTRNGLNCLRFELHDFGYKNNIPMLINDFSDEIYSINPTKMPVLNLKKKNFKINDLLELKGGVIGKSNHSSPDLFNGEVVEHLHLIMDIIFKKNSQTYSELCALIMAKSAYNKTVINDHSIKILDNNHLERIKQNACFKEFVSHGLIVVNDNVLNFSSSDLFLLIRNAGLILEQYVYTKLKQSNQFDDVLMSVVIKQYHDEDIITNREIDLIVLKDLKLIFVSCKLYEVDIKDVMEIRIHNDLYGNYLSKSCLIAVNRMECFNNNLYQRSKEMDVCIINQDELESHAIVKEVMDIMNDTFDFDDNTYCHI